MKRYCRFLRATQQQIAAGGPLPAFDILHEPDNSCCRREGWSKTNLAMLELAGLRMVEVRLDLTAGRRMSRLDEV
jgi:hypothetical protein